MVRVDGGSAEQRCFAFVGPTRAWWAGEEIPLRPRERALLAAIAVDHPAVVTTDRLIDRMWPRAVPATARNSLHNHVARLRKVLGPDVIETAGDGYRLGPAHLDLDRLTDDPSSTGASAEPPADGLPFADLADEGFGVVEARRRFIDARTRARVRWASTHLDDPRAVTLLEHTVEEDAFSETLWETLARAYAAGGRRRDAAIVFSRARRVLASAGLAPGQALDDAERILLADPTTVTAATTDSGGGTSRSQHHCAAHVVDQVGPATPIVVVRGAAGSGKSTVLGLVAPGLAAAGHHVVTTRCEPEPVRPLEPIAVVVEDLLSRAPTLTDQLDDPAPLTLLGPDLARLIGRGNRPRDPERRRLEDAVAQVLTHPAFSPLTIVIDDLHWATRATWALLRAALARSATSSCGFGVVGAWRGRAEGPLLDVDPVLVEAPGLSVEEIGLLLASTEGLPGADPGEGPARQELAVRLHTATGGNPLFVRELVRSLRSHGDGGAVPVPDSPRDWTLPDSVSTLLHARVAELGRDGRAAAFAAAVLGRTQRRADLLALAPSAGVDACISSGVLRPVDDTTTEFDHDLLRRAALESLGDARRIELHDAAARAIENAPDARDRITETAHHAVEAGELDPLGATHYARLAAEIHTARANHGEAADLLGRAAAVLDRVGRWPARRAELMVAEGAARLRGGDPTARATLEAALTLARTLDDPTLLAEATIELCRLGPTSETGANDPIAVAAIHDSLARVVDPGQRARVAAAATMVHSMAGETARCRELLEQALVDAAADGRPEVLADVLPFSYMTLSEPDDLPVRRRLADELEEVGRSLRRPDVEWEAHQIRFSNALQMGDPTLRTELHRMETLAATIRERSRDWEMHYLRSTVAQLDDDLPGAEAIITASLDYADCVAASRVVAVYGVHLLALRIREDRSGELLDDVSALVADQPTVGAWRAAQALAACEAGAADLAADAFDAALADDARTLDRDFSFTGALYCLGRCAVGLADRDRARAVLPWLEPIGDRWSWVGTTTLGPMAEPLVGWLELAGRAAAAEALRTEAAESARRLGATGYATRLEAG